eukprot:6478945-Amphidinium_carterae.1
MSCFSPYPAPLNVSRVRLFLADREIMLLNVVLCQFLGGPSTGLLWQPLRVAKSIRVLSAPMPVVEVPVKLRPGSWRSSGRTVWFNFYGCGTTHAFVVDMDRGTIGPKADPDLVLGFGRDTKYIVEIPKQTRASSEQKT